MQCGALTHSGLLNMAQHGRVCAISVPPSSTDMSSQKKDLYHKWLGFLIAVDSARIWVSTSMEGHMLQVAGTMLATMD